MTGVGATTLAYLRGEKDLLQEQARFAQARKQLQSSVQGLLDFPTKFQWIQVQRRLRITQKNEASKFNI